MGIPLDTALRLLTNETVMGEETLTVDHAWSVYERWLDDPRVEFHPEPRNVDTAFRHAAPITPRLFRLETDIVS
ncbi:MAG TPA: hypothetical protein VK686_00240 [Bryobacteraceae bacterium]|jgi:hypothetical protein|nr:hypothetical protein [Bryobacteraceae bacterium]